MASRLSMDNQERDLAMRNIEDLPISDVVALGDPNFSLDTDESCRWLHEHTPVYWHAGRELWIVSKWEDIRFVSRNPSLFCSSRGIMLGQADADGAPHEVAASEDRLVAPTRDRRVRGSLFEMDPPLHTRYRQLVGWAFTPRMVAA